MKLALLPSASVILSTVLSFFAVAPSAYADGSSPRYTEKALDAMLAGPTGDARESLALPTTLREEPRSFFPQGRQSQQTPFIDFSHFEMGGYAGIAAFSSDFEADPTWVVGVSARVPVPGIPGNWGIFAQGFISHITRDLPFYYDHRAGSWLGGEVGADYTFVRDDVWYLRAQAGMLYAWWNNVNALDNGIGFLLGVQVGFYWIKHNPNAVVTINPQFSYDGSNWLGFFTVGFSYDF
ncbi:MAG TPA: hypothetical protein VNM14_04560 [Planctomycetota bacterium]|jgi:hypothetical protein|nr:hypothetical protein [Planctomycetota bacterium]